MATVMAQSGILKVLYSDEIGGYVTGCHQGGATVADLNAVRKELAARLQAISPEAWRLASAWAAARMATTADLAAAKERVRKESQETLDAEVE